MNHQEQGNVFRLFFPENVSSERDNCTFPEWFFSLKGLVKYWRQSSNSALSAPSAAALEFHVQNRKGKQQLALSEQHLQPGWLSVLTGWHIGTMKKLQPRKFSFSSQKFKGFCDDGFSIFLKWLITSGTWDAFPGTQLCWTRRCSVPGGAYPIMTLEMHKFKPLLS